jgi:hypothetical protein
MVDKDTTFYEIKEKAYKEYPWKVDISVEEAVFKIPLAGKTIKSDDKTTRLSDVCWDLKKDDWHWSCKGAKGVMVFLKTPVQKKYISSFNTYVVFPKVYYTFNTIPGQWFHLVKKEGSNYSFLKTDMSDGAKYLSLEKENEFIIKEKLEENVKSPYDFKTKITKRDAFLYSKSGKLISGMYGSNDTKLTGSGDKLLGSEDPYFIDPDFATASDYDMAAFKLIGGSPIANTNVKTHIHQTLTYQGTHYSPNCEYWIFFDEEKGTTIYESQNAERTCKGFNEKPEEVNRRMRLPNTTGAKTYSFVLNDYNKAELRFHRSWDNDPDSVINKGDDSSNIKTRFVAKKTSPHGAILLLTDNGTLVVVDAKTGMDLKMFDFINRKEGDVVKCNSDDIFYTRKLRYPYGLFKHSKVQRDGSIIYRYSGTRNELRPIQKKAAISWNPSVEAKWTDTANPDLDTTGNPEIDDKQISCGNATLGDIMKEYTPKPEHSASAPPTGVKKEPVLCKSNNDFFYIKKGSSYLQIFKQDEMKPSAMFPHINSYLTKWKKSKSDASVFKIEKTNEPIGHEFGKKDQYFVYTYDNFEGKVYLRYHGGKIFTHFHAKRFDHTEELLLKPNNTLTVECVDYA